MLFREPPLDPGNPDHRPDRRNAPVSVTVDTVYMADLRTALMMIRAWVERGSSAPLRVTLRHTKDVANGIEQSVTFTTPEAGAAAVKIWLDEVVEADRVDEVADAARRP